MTTKETNEMLKEDYPARYKQGYRGDPNGNGYIVPSEKIPASVLAKKNEPCRHCGGRKMLIRAIGPNFKTERICSNCSLIQ
jgi:hypothetical protein